MQELPKPATTTDQAPTTRGPLRGALSWTRAEDWLLALWLVLVAPLFVRALGNAAPFQSERPLDGFLEFAAVIGVACCIATTASDRPPTEAGETRWAIVGPAIGGLILVYASGTAALGISEPIAWFPLLAAVAFAVVLRLRRTSLPTSARRALITPYILVTGTLFAGVIEAVTGGPRPITGPLSDLASNQTAAGAFIGFSAIYYVMLVFAPRQLAESEGSPLSWVARYLMFLAALVLGLGIVSF